MDQKKYITYTADQLLNDDYFLTSTLHPTNESMSFWANLENQNESFAMEINIARNFLKSIKKNASSPVIPFTTEKELWRRILQENKTLDRRHTGIIITCMGIATAISLLIGFFWFSKDTSALQVKETDYLAILHNTPPNVDEAKEVQLILSENERIAFKGKEVQLEHTEEGTFHIHAGNETHINSDVQSEQLNNFNQLIVPPGRRSTLTFDDGTKVWINSGSKVIYPVQFDKDKREIFVEGEIFLDIKADPERPFILKSKQLDIRVLGTQFNFSSYETDHFVQVVLVNGKVEIQTHEKEKSTLSPNQLFSYNTRTKEKSIAQVDVSEFVAWKDGYYQFRGQTMDKVLRKISQYYEKEIQWNAKLAELTCSGKLDMKENLNEVLCALQNAAPVIVIKNDEQIYIDVKP